MSLSPVHSSCGLFSIAERGEMEDVVLARQDGNTYKEVGLYEVEITGRVFVIASNEEEAISQATSEEERKGERLKYKARRIPFRIRGWSDRQF